MTTLPSAIPDGALAELPIFPLPQVVLFPRAMLPLHVFEPRYRTMLRDCLATYRAMAIALIVDSSERDAHHGPRIASVAGVGVIVEHQELADGRSNILLYGCGRVALEEAPFVPPYRRARATKLVDVEAAIDAEERTALLATANAFTGDLHQRDPGVVFRLPQNLEPSTLADLCAHHLIIDSDVRQRVLEELDPRERVRLVTTELARQHGQLQREGGGVAN